MSKFYAVKVGRKPGIYNTWGEAQKQVSGFSGAKFKSFSNEEEALKFISDENVPQKETIYTAYVDGSFNKEKQQYGSGIVILKEHKVLKEISVMGNNKNYLESYQIAGEVLACIEAIKWAINNAIEEITIFFDYQGIESWASGEWKRNKPISIDYYNEFVNLSKDIKVYFKKVKGHSGDTYNDLADKLASEAANSNKEFGNVTADIIENTNNESNIQNIFKEVKGKKTGINLEIFVEDELINSDTVYNDIKKIWRADGFLIKEIKEIKSIFTVENKSINVEITDIHGIEHYYEIGVNKKNG